MNSLAGSWLMITAMPRPSGCQIGQVSNIICTTPITASNA